MMRRRQALPLEAKVVFTQERVKAWYLHYHGDVYIAYSGGKDSTVLMDIVKGMFPDVPAVFCDTGLEYPEVRELALRKADVVLKPKMTFKQVIEEYGYPFPTKEQAQFIFEYRHTKSEKLRELRWNGVSKKRSYAISKRWRFLADAPFEVSGKCCDVMKKAPFHKFERERGLRPILATMADESSLRKQEYMRNGCNAFDIKRAKSTPIAFWTEQDVLGYLKESGIEYAPCYGEISEVDGRLLMTGVERTGCMFCLFGIHFDKEPNRFQRMQANYPKQYEYCIDKLGIGKVLDYVGIPYACQPTLFD